MTKEERIHEAYKELFDNEDLKEKDNRFNGIKNFIDNDGWLSGNIHNVDKKLIECSGHEIRPKSLQGIENNNGWIKLQGLANEIQDRCSIWIETKNGDIEYLKENEFLPIGYAVAYQVAEKPKKRIY